MTKALIDIESDLWSLGREYAKDHEMNVNEFITHAMENLLLPIAGKHVPDTNSVTTNETNYDVAMEEPINVTPMPVEEVERRTAPPSWKRPTGIKPDPGFGSPRPAPKPVKRK